MNKEAMGDVIKGCYKAINGHPVYQRLMSGGDRPSIEDGKELLVLLSVIHDELRLCVNAQENPL